MSDEIFNNPYFNDDNTSVPTDDTQALQDKQNAFAAESESADNIDAVSDAQIDDVDDNVGDSTEAESFQSPVADAEPQVTPSQPYVNPETYQPVQSFQPAGAYQVPQSFNAPQAAPVDSVPQPQTPQPPYSYEWYGRAEGQAHDNQNNVNRTYYTNPTPPPQKKEKKGVSKGMFFAGIAICLCLSFVAGFAGTMAWNMLNSRPATVKNGVSINQVESQGSNTAYYDSGLSTVEIVNKTADSVVEITTETVKTGVFAQQYIESGAGSGVIIDVQGYIVTNHHVIDGATKISVTLRDGTAYDATLVGSDSELDIALLEITPDTTLVAATFGDSNNLAVGQRTVAIGNPLGQLGGSVTEGIISALNRDVVIDGQTMSLLQTDTAINPGNSGGGLFDSNGNLIGIVNAKSSGSEVEGLGFAIPINDVIDVIGDLSEYGYVRGRVDLGITFIDVDSQQVAWMYGLDKTGCYIYSVDTNTNADVAGLSSGDRVISVNGNEITNSDDVEAIIKNCSVGEEVTFEVETTKGKTYKISFELEEYVPESENENFFENGGSLNDYSYWWSEYIG